MLDTVLFAHPSSTWSQDAGLKYQYAHLLTSFLHIHQTLSSPCFPNLKKINGGHITYLNCPVGCREQLTEALQRIDVLGSTAARARAESHVWKDQIRSQLADSGQQLRREQAAHRAALKQAALLNTLLEEGAEERVQLRRRMATAEAGRQEASSREDSAKAVSESRVAQLEAAAVRDGEMIQSLQGDIQEAHAAVQAAATQAASAAEELAEAKQAAFKEAAAAEDARQNAAKLAQRLHRLRSEVNKLGMIAEDSQVAVSAAHSKISALSQQLMAARDQLSAAKDAKAALEAQLANPVGSATYQAALEYRSGAGSRRSLDSTALNHTQLKAFRGMAEAHVQQAWGFNALLARLTAATMIDRVVWRSCCLQQLLLRAADVNARRVASEGARAVITHITGLQTMIAATITTPGSSAQQHASPPAGEQAFSGEDAALAAQWLDRLPDNEAAMLFDRDATCCPPSQALVRQLDDLGTTARRVLQDLGQSPRGQICTRAKLVTKPSLRRTRRQSLTAHDEGSKDCTSGHPKPLDTGAAVRAAALERSRAAIALIIAPLFAQIRIAKSAPYVKGESLSETRSVMTAAERIANRTPTPRHLRREELHLQRQELRRQLQQQKELEQQQRRFRILSRASIALPVVLFVAHKMFR